MLHSGAQLPPHLPQTRHTGKPNTASIPTNDPPATASLVLLERVRAGDTAALNRLMDRYLPKLSRWASGRLPQLGARRVRYRRPGPGHAHPQRRQPRPFRGTGRRGIAGLPARRGDEPHPRRDSPPAAHAGRRIRSIRRIPANSRSPLDAAIGAETLAKYDRALERLDAETREAVIARIEMGCSYAEVAELMDKPSADAARMTVSRALVRLAEEMRRG